MQIHKMNGLNKWILLNIFVFEFERALFSLKSSSGISILVGNINGAKIANAFSSRYERGIAVDFDMISMIVSCNASASLAFVATGGS